MQRFEGIRLSAIYSSPLERCVQTVEPLAAARRLTLRTDDAFLEMEAGNDPTNLNVRLQVAMAGERLFRRWVEHALEGIKGAAESTPAGGTRRT